MNGILWYVGRRRPLLFFGIPGMMMLAAGLIVGVSVLSVVQQRHVMPVARALVSVFLCLGGVLTVYAGLILSTIGKLETVLQDAAATSRPAALGEAAVSPSPALFLLLFGIPGMLALLAGLAWGAWAVSAAYSRTVMLYGSYIASASIALAGLATWLTGVILHALHDILAGVGEGKNQVAQ